MAGFLFFILKFIIQIVLLVVVSGITTITSLFITELIIDLKNKKRDMPERNIRR